MSEQKHSLQFALIHESLDFFKGFHFCELRMDLLNSLQVKSSEKVFKINDLEYSEWTRSLLQKGDLCSERVKIH